MVAAAARAVVEAHVEVAVRVQAGRLPQQVAGLGGVEEALGRS